MKLSLLKALLCIKFLSEALSVNRLNKSRDVKNIQQMTFTEVDYPSLNHIDRSGIDHSRSKAASRLSILSLRKISTTLGNFIKTTFLPSGYPNSVPPEYLQYQTWNLIQDLCSYLRGIMSMKAVLEGLGVGRADTTSVDAALLWILRDGASMIGGLLFTALSSAYFGQNAKSWRLFADYVNNVGITLDLFAPLSRRLFLPLICISSVFKALCGIAAGATGSVISEHWGSLEGNIAEVNSKNGAQHTAVSLIGLLLSVPFAKLACSSPYIMWSVYSTLTLLHIISNYQAMRTLRLKSINVSRGSLLIHKFVQLFQQSTSTVTIDSNIINATPKKTELSITNIDSFHSILQQNIHYFTLKSVASTEPILRLLLPSLFDSWTSDYSGKYGMKIIYQTSPSSSSSTSSSSATSVNKIRIPIYLWASPSEVTDHYMKKRNIAVENINQFIAHTDSNHNYVIYTDKIDSQIKHIFICFSHICTPQDQIKALLQAYLIVTYPSYPLDEVIHLMDKLYPIFINLLVLNQWDIQRVFLRPREARAYLMETKKKSE